MPYDYSNMSYLSKGYMQGVQDPRYDMFMSGISAEFPIYLVNTTTKSFFGGLVNYFVMFPNAWLMQTSEVMDGMCTFGWIKNSGIDLTWTWKGAIGKLILGFFILYFLFSICKNIWNTISGNKTIKQVASQVIPVFLVTILCIGLLMIPNKAGTAIENTVGNLLQVFSNQLDDTSEAYQQLYAGDFDSLNASQKSALKYWALYANIWSTYTTNHSLGDDSAVFDVNRGGNEYREYDTSPARLEGNTTVNLWQIALLEELLTNDELSAYRTVDHFMAPVITPGEGAEFSVSTNPNYNGYFYSEPPIFSTLLTLSVAILTFIKMLCFLELITNILLLFLKVLRYSTQQDNDINKGFTKTIQEIGWALVRTLFYDGFIFLCIFSTFNVLGSINLISIILSAVVFCYLKWLFTSGSKSVLYPKFLDLMSVVFRKAGKALKAVAPTANALASANDASDEQLNLLKKYTKANNKKLGISDDHDDAIKMRKKDNRSLNRHQATKPIRESVKQKAKNHKERKENSFLTNAASVASRINTHNPFSKNYVDKHDKALDEEERRREEEERKRKLEEEKGENKPKDKKEDKDSLLTNNSENNNKKRGDKYRKENNTNSNSKKQPTQDKKANDNNRKVSSKKGNDVITPSQKQTKDVKTKQQNNSKKKPININLKEKNNDKK